MHHYRGHVSLSPLEIHRPARARAYGFADPALWLARIRNFAQPSEVAEPIELLRAGILFHARGIVNTKAIQHNLDWVWPYWVERQFDPEDVSFIPRGFSISHVNLTHRNWTAIGLPELSIYPIVDPRGLVTPVQDGWSLDFWLLDASRQGRSCPAACPTSRPPGAVVRRRPRRRHHGATTTTVALRQTASVVLQNGEPAVPFDVEAASPRGGALVVAVRPYNPEGVQFIDRIAALRGQRRLAASTTGWKSTSIGRPISCSPPTTPSGDVFSLLGESPNADARQPTTPATSIAKSAWPPPPPSIRFAGDQAASTCKSACRCTRKSPRSETRRPSTPA